jgi:hypothetical protein
MKRGLMPVRALLKKWSMAPRRVGHIPAKADPVEQRRFLENKLQPLRPTAVAGKREVWFVDGAHLLHAAVRAGKIRFPCSNPWRGRSP